VSCTVVVARSLDEALRALERATERSRVLAGGTDLMVELHSGRTRPDFVVDVWRVDELRGIRAEADGLRIGALTTCAELKRSPLVRQRADLLASAADEVGAEQIQARATLGGNLGTASPAADLNPVLVALGAGVRLASLAGARELDVGDFLVGYRSTARRRDELIESIFVPARPAGELRGFRKVGTRRAQSIAKVVVALALRVESGSIVSIRAAAGSVAPRTIRLSTLERELAGRAPDAQLFDRAAAASARTDIAPIDDVRSTAGYRRHAFRRIVRTLLCAVNGLA